MNKKSKFIGTLSLNINTDDFNYGAVLHSWAFQQFLLKNDYKCEIIDYITPHLENFDFINPILGSIKAKRIKSLIKYILVFFPYKRRYKKFREFINSNMIISEKQYTQHTLNDETLKYDTLICESDVIWYYGFFHGNYDKTFFLALDSMKNKKRIAYSPSMSSMKYIEETKEELKKLLNNLDYISCRETYELETLKELSGKEVTHVMDPVLLLERKDYDKIACKRIINDNYLLLYLPVDNNKKLRKVAKDYAKKNSLKILEISTKLRPSLNHKVLTTAGVEEFISCIKYADVVFTNSFHAICFSVIYEKDFYAFTRSLNGKVIDICKTLGLEDRYLENNKIKKIEHIDYKKVTKRVEELKNRSQKWIINALND